MEKPKKIGGSRPLFLALCEWEKTYGLADDFECYKGQIPPEYVSIATDPFGNQVLLGIDNQNQGKVCFWDHEEELDLPEFSNLYFLANSFSEFVKSLTND